MKPFRSQQGSIKHFVFIAVCAGLFFVGVMKYAIMPPKSFPTGATITVVKGDTLGALAQRLWQGHIVGSPEAFKLFMIVLGSEHRLSEGEYHFDRPITSLEVALKISGNDFNLVQHRVTFPEGFTNHDMALRLVSTFPGFDGASFESLAKDKQGKLFPDTYGFSASPSPEEVVTTMKKNFDEKIASLAPDVAAQSRSLEEILTMASLIEKEANGGQEARIVSGILWKRIERGIPLQVDAPFLFILGKTSAELTRADLAIDSPYNTYRYKGLPPAPINNPGLAAIEAALHPEESPYLYYLHDGQGEIHYARTYAEHLENKKKHLQ